MKITSASKKVLASALSAAMVVAFAPTVAFGAEEANIPADAVAYFTAEELITTGSNGSNEIKEWTKVTKSYTTSKYGTAQAAMNAALADYPSAIKYRNQGALTLNTNLAGSFTLTDGATYTIDLNGYTLTNDGFATDESKDTLILGTSVLTIKNGTVEAVKADNGKATEAITTASTGKLSVVSGTYDAITADIQTITDGTFNKTVTDATDGFDIKGGTFAVASSNGNALAISANSTVNVSGKVSVSATTSKDDKAAVAVKGNVVVGKTGDLTVTAASTAKQAHKDIDGNTAATAKPAVVGIDGTLTATAKGAVASVSATTKDDSSYAWGVRSFSGSAEISALVGGEFDAKINTAPSNATPVYAKQSLAIADTATLIKGGKYTGFINAIADASGTVDNPAAGVLAGSFTDGDTVKGTAGHAKLFADKDLMEDGDYYTVYTKTLSASDDSTNVPSTENKQAIEDAVADVVEAVAYGDAVSNLKYAEGQSADTLKAAIKAGKVAYEVAIEEYKAKTATDTEAADYAAIEAAMKQVDKYVVEAGTFSVALTNGKVGGEKVVYGYLTNLGTANRGVARTFEFYTISKTGVEAYGETMVQLVDGKVVDVASKADKKGNYVFSTNNTGMYAVVTLSPAAIEDTAKDDKPAAPEKATQSISVEKKSMAVKLGSKKTKTAKGKSFAMGALAETDLTIAKVSGSSKITVSGDKVKLAKGVKRGTYKATVSLKAAASDAYLADATTITVKFVIK